MRESRALAVLEMLVHLTKTLPDKYVVGSAEIPDDLAKDVSDVVVLHDPSGYPVYRRARA
jgi:hypothetical protein